MSEQELDSQGRTIRGPTDTAELRLIAELTDSHQDSLSKQAALSTPGHSVLVNGYRELVKAAKVGKARVEEVRVKSRAYRRAKLRKKDLQDLSGLRAAVDDLAKEIDSIAHANDLYMEHPGHSPEATTVYQERAGRLQSIREKLAGLKLVMTSVDGKVSGHSC